MNTGQTLTTADDEGVPTVTLVLTPDEIGESGGVSTVTAMLSGAPSEAVEVTVSAVAVPPAVAEDFSLSTNRKLTIAADATSSAGEVTITAVDNNVDAPDKEVTVSASVSDGAGVSAPASGTLTITDDDERGVTVAPMSLNVPEGASRTYTVVLDSEPTDEVTVTVDVPSGAVVSVDEAMLRFTAGDWRRPQTVRVTARSDAAAGDPVTLTHTVRGGDYEGVSAADVAVTVAEADAPTLTIEDGRAREGGGRMLFRVRLSRETSNEVTVDYQTSNGTAKAGEDYEAESGMLTFPANTTTPQEIRVPIIDNAVDESDEETFTVTLSNAQHATLADGEATGTIEDDDVTRPSPPPPPPTPAAPMVTDSSTTSATLRWPVLNHDGPAITSYDVRYRQGSDGDWMDGPQDVAGTSATITGLSPDTVYEVQVRASSTAGDGEWSARVAVRTDVQILKDRFSVSVDLDGSEGDQSVSFLTVSSGGVVPIQIFGADIHDTRGLVVRVGYDSTQVAYEGFDAGDLLRNVRAVVKRDSTAVRIYAVSLSGSARVDNGLMGTLRFRATDALSETEIRLADVGLIRGGQLEAMTRSVSVALQVAAPPSPDFNGDGGVDYPDFILFAGAFGYGEGDAKYEAGYDLNGDGGIEFADLVIFAGRFGNTMNRAPVFNAPRPVTRSIAENSPAGQNIGDPVAATDADGDALTYSLWGADAEHFAIDASTGQIRTAGTYDFEQKIGYAVIVRAGEGEGGRASLVVNIAITDVHE